MNKAGTTSSTPRKNPPRRSRSKVKPKDSNRNKAYGVRKNSLSRSLSEIPKSVSQSPTTSPRRASVCYVTPIPDTKTPCPEILITNEDSSDSENSTKYKFIKAVKEIIKTRQQSAECRREYEKMKEEMETTANVGRPEIVIVQEGRISPMPKLQSEPTILSFPFGSDDKKDEVDGQPCQHEKCIHAPITPRSKAGARICLLKAVALLAARRPKTKKELKRNPVTTADEKLLREQEKSDNSEHAHSDTNSDCDPMEYLRGCRYLRGTNEDKELSIEEIFQ